LNLEPHSRHNAAGVAAGWKTGGGLKTGMSAGKRTADMNVRPTY